MAQQTAVEWLQSEWQKKDIDISIRDLWHQAKAMEKEQIIKAFNYGSWLVACKEIDSIDYYTETYSDGKKD
jgi:hypothetical protein